MKLKKVTAVLLAGAMVTMSVGSLVGCTKKEAAEEKTATTDKKADEKTSDVDWANFTIDPTKISKEKLDTTLYLGCSVRGLENPYIVTITEGMDMFAEYL